MNEIFKNIYLETGETLRKERKARSLTQEQLAATDDKLDRSKISDIENGKEDFHFSTLVRVFAAMDLEIEVKVRKKKMK